MVGLQGFNEIHLKKGSIKAYIRGNGRDRGKTNLEGRKHFFQSLKQGLEIRQFTLA